MSRKDRGVNYVVHTVITFRFAVFSYGSELVARPAQRQSLLSRKFVESDWVTAFPMCLMRWIRRREAQNSLLRSDKTIGRPIIRIPKVEIAMHGTRIPPFRALLNRVRDRRIDCGTNSRYPGIRQWQDTDQLCVYAAGHRGWVTLTRIEACTPIAGGCRRGDAGAKYVF